MSENSDSRGKIDDYVVLATTIITLNDFTLEKRRRNARTCKKLTSLGERLIKKIHKRDCVTEV